MELIGQSLFALGFVPHVLSGHMTWNDFFDLMAQRRQFDRVRPAIELKYRGKIVGFANNELIVADQVHELFDKAHAKYGRRMVYFEAIGFDIL